MGRYYRIQRADEPIESLLGEAGMSRPDGWCSPDAEEAGEQRPGVSACESLDDLAAWAELYSAAAGEGDSVLELDAELAGDDRDERAVRVRVAGARVLGDARAFLAAWSEDLGWVRDDVEEYGATEALSHLAPDARAWVAVRLGA